MWGCLVCVVLSRDNTPYTLYFAKSNRLCYDFPMSRTIRLTAEALKSLQAENSELFDIAVNTILRSAIDIAERDGTTVDIPPPVMSVIRARLKDTMRTSKVEKQIQPLGGENSTALVAATRQRYNGDLSEVLGRVDGSARVIG